MSSWPGWREARAELCRLRENGERKSQRVVELGDRLLANYSGRLGDEGKRALIRIPSLT